eukprot:gnl/TRDRNA2_/TRDRNA2_80384_c0_seq2.p1 gnl/TRDRNA2_/TRDRNA2_80384_c0~~gnl/TRDRNA2_/TRDRNA2_80384_c0_seq2.p1  ORF type:complete len:349 (-),score=65.28 gnl/TRDRNA2_/TRDRNA2_80384_c0_seq2:81-1127(-)
MPGEAGVHGPSCDVSPTSSSATPRIRPFQELITAPGPVGGHPPRPVPPAAPIIGDSAEWPSMQDLEELELDDELLARRLQAEENTGHSSLMSHTEEDASSVGISALLSDTGAVLDVTDPSVPTPARLAAASAPRAVANPTTPMRRPSPSPRAGDQDESDWSGRVATERTDRAQLDCLLRGEVQAATVKPSSAQPAADNGLPAARVQLAMAFQALEVCEAQLRRASEDDKDLRKVAQDFAALEHETAQARVEADKLRRDIQRLRGLPKELALLPNNDLHALQQDLSAALRNVHAELENRTKCCVCRVSEREVVLQPCMHLALCVKCACRVTQCPLCRASVECQASVRVA